ncbi:ABC transporter substrate-binding protein [Bacillus alkalisoli]|uniref:ABC transporter substrate-binding protein n=1 Tax=Bacillus alkalisoli TaxID=2011008 RepID=UPI000C23EE92|nr:ABC transporter substrate-binding protein [Bacillus alkalisoli]
MKKNKIFMILSIVCAFLLVFTGCSKNNGQETSTQKTSTTPSTGSKEVKKVELTVAARAGAMADALEAVVEKYETETGVKVNINALPYDNLKETVVLDVRNNSGAHDLVMIDDPWMPEFAGAGMLANLDEYYKDGIDSDFVPKSVALGKEPYNTGSLYALPLIGNVQMFFYREDLLEKYNMTTPSNWDEVIEYAEMVVKEEPETYGYALRGQRGNPIVSNYLPLFWAYGGTVLDSDNMPQVNSEAGVKAMETYMKLKDLGPTGVETFDSDQIATALTQGQVAMTIAWPSWVAQVDNEESSKVAGKIGFSPVPMQVNESAAMIGNWLLGIPRTSKNIEEAVEFLNWVTSAETQKEMALLGGGAPTRTSVYNDSELIEVYRHFPAQLEALENSVVRPRTERWSQIEDTWGLYLSQILAGQVDIQEGLDRANKEIEAIVSR